MVRRRPERKEYEICQQNREKSSNKSNPQQK